MVLEHDHQSERVSRTPTPPSSGKEWQMSLSMPTFAPKSMEINIIIIIINIIINYGPRRASPSPMRAEAQPTSTPNNFKTAIPSV